MNDVICYKGAVLKHFRNKTKQICLMNKKSSADAISRICPKSFVKKVEIRLVEKSDDEK